MAGLYLQEKVFVKARNLTELLLNNQQKDGAWYYCFEAGLLTDACMIILLRHLYMNDETLINKLARRIAGKQEPSGPWKVFFDEPEGNLSATIECYYALLMAGYKKKTDPEMQRAKEFIVAKGGLPEASSYTKIILTLTGHYPWEYASLVPVELILLPSWTPINFFDLNGYARVHMAPIIICAGKKYAYKMPDAPDLSDLYPASAKQRPPLKTPDVLQKEVEKIKHIPLTLGEIRKLALEKTERFILGRLEWDGTLYSYFTATFPMIFALLALGYDKRHPVVVKAVNGLKTMACHAISHQQTTTSTVWDTALISYALQEAGLSHYHPAMEKAAS